MGASSTTDVTRNKAINVRVSATERRTIAEKARRLGMKPATWMRMVALREKAPQS